MNDRRWKQNCAGIALGLGIVALLVTLTGCTAELQGPAKAFGVGSQKDRTAKVSKTIFGASASIPLTDLSGEGWEVTYDKATGSFTLKLAKFDQNWSSTMTIENARIKENQELYTALTAAQQEVYDRRIDAWKEVGIHGIDAAASAIGLLVNMPGGAEPARDLVGGLMRSVGPQLAPKLMSALAAHGVPIAPTPGGP